MEWPLVAAGYFRPRRALILAPVNALISATSCSGRVGLSRMRTCGYARSGRPRELVWNKNGTFLAKSAVATAGQFRAPTGSP